MNTKQIRQTILDLAIRGELVHQDPTDEPASVLLERIRAEKEQLIKDKKLKRDKKDNEPIDEVPFELPEGWVWCRLGEIAKSNIGLTYSPTNVSTEGIPVLRSNNIKEDKLVLDDLIRVSGEIQEKNYVKKGDVLICARNGSRNLLGKCTIINEIKEPMAFGAFMAICRSSYNNWICQILRSDYFQRYLDNSNSTAINQITQSMLLEFPVPLPPLAEQKRIVEKVEQLFALVDTIETHKEQLKALVKQAKNQVLNYAIAGKLTHQDPNDEPAEELLKRIGKTTATDTPYEKLPEGWAWCRLGDITKTIATKPYQILQSEIEKNGDFPVISQSANYIEGFSSDETKLLKVEDFIIVFGDHTRVVKYIDFDFIVGADGVKVILPNNNLSKYLYYLILNGSYKIENRGYSRHFQFLQKEFFPLPPLQEQHRIVQKIETYFSFLDTIENSL